jgi:cytochrome c1
VRGEVGRERFGDMPQQPDITDADVANIVAYVRQLKVAAGIR